MSLTASRIAQLALLLLLAATAPALGQPQVARFDVIEPTQEDIDLAGDFGNVNFGAAVAVSGRTAAIGIPYESQDLEGPGPGRVGIYSKTDAGSWIRTATLLPSNASDLRFGQDVDACGKLVLVAAEHSTYVFRGRGVHWREIMRIGPPAPDSVLGPFACSNNSFAQTVSTLNDQGEVVGSVVHVYESRGGGGFELAAKLRASDPNDSIGRSLAMEGSTLVAGSEPDAAYVFMRHGRRWIERQKLQSPVPNGAEFGAAVAISDRIIIVGAPRVDLPGGEPLFPHPEGDAFVYLPHRGSWFESQHLNPPLPEFLPSIGFGTEVAMGHRLAGVTVPDTQVDQRRPTSVVTVFERIGVEFTGAHWNFAVVGEDLEKIIDIDMSGRRLVLSVWESEFFGRVLGRAAIVEFEASADSLTQGDQEEADEP